jgi:hypothetical protein
MAAERSRAAAPLTGGCQCGRVRYRVDGTPTESSVCHCRMCQKAHGAPAVAFLTVRRDQLEWTRGAPAIYRSSDVAVRTFCRDCGTPLTFRLVAEPAVDVATATLDDPAAVPPDRQFGIEGKVPWFDTIHTLPGRTAGECPTSHQHPDHDTETWPPEDTDP